jgi:excisionase family DNA binding protein
MSAESNDRKDHWSIAELANHFGVSRDTIRREIKRRAVDAYLIGKQIRIPNNEAMKIRRPRNTK